jgi:hypothetical protein
MVLWFHIICCSIVISAIFMYYVAILVLLFALFLFSSNIIDLVPYKWYESTFLDRKLWVNFFQGKYVFQHLTTTKMSHYVHKPVVKE